MPKHIEYKYMGNDTKLQLNHNSILFLQIIYTYNLIDPTNKR